MSSDRNCQLIFWVNVRTQYMVIVALICYHFIIDEYYFVGDETNFANRSNRYQHEIVSQHAYGKRIHKTIFANI